MHRRWSSTQNFFHAKLPLEVFYRDNVLVGCCVIRKIPRTELQFQSPEPAFFCSIISRSKILSACMIVVRTDCHVSILRGKWNDISNFWRLLSSSRFRLIEEELNLWLHFRPNFALKPHRITGSVTLGWSGSSAKVAGIMAHQNYRWTEWPWVTDHQ